MSRWRRGLQSRHEATHTLRAAYEPIGFADETRKDATMSSETISRTAMVSKTQPSGAVDLAIVDIVRRTPADARRAAPAIWAMAANEATSAMRMFIR